MINETTNAMMPVHYMDGGFGPVGHHGFGFFHGSLSILLVIGLIVLAVWVVRRVVHGKGACGHGSSGSALSLLSERFAKGEIDEDEYRTKREVLRSRK